MKNRDVAASFLRRENRVVHTGSLTSARDKLFSYDTCIGQFAGSKLIGNATKYSTTSSRHLNYIRSYVDRWTTKPVPRGAHDLILYLL